MNLKQKIKHFFSLRRSANGGFTLIELIVVIAVLAILAGVAVPAYSGYVAKANMASDLQLLTAVNKAFNAAVAAEGDDILTISSANLVINSDGTLKMDSLEPAKYQASFAQLFQDNGDAKFKVITKLNYNSTKHLFEGVDEDAMIESLKQVISASNFNGKLEELTDDVGGLVNALGGYLNTEGIDAIVGTGFDDYLDNVLNLQDKSDSQKMANAAVLYLAHAAANMSDSNVENAKATLAQALIDYAENETPVTDEIISSLATDTDSGLASYAMLYATAEAIAMKEGPDSDAYKALQEANPTNPTSVLTVVGQVFGSVEPDALLEYIGDGAGSDFDKDMDAYFQTLQTVNTKEDELKAQLDSSDMFTTENETIKNLLDKLQE